MVTIGLKVAGSLPPVAPFTPIAIPNILACHAPSVTSEYVEKQLLNLPEKKAVGLDRMPGKLIHVAVPTIPNSLTFILNLSMQSAKFISEWKHTKVLPLFKSDSLMETNNL